MYRSCIAVVLIWVYMNVVVLNPISDGKRMFFFMRSCVVLYEIDWLRIGPS